MSEREFSAQVARLYREPQRLGDEDRFLVALQARIDAEQRRRRGVLASCGLVGGVTSLAALWQFDAASWATARFAELVQALQSVVGSIDTLQLSMLGVGLVIAVALHELVRVVSHER